MEQFCHAQHSGIPEAVKSLPSAAINFDALPASAQIDLACLKAVTSKSRATLYRWIEQGILPKPHKLGATRNFWTVGEIRAALNQGVAA